MGMWCISLMTRHGRNVCGSGWMWSSSRKLAMRNCLGGGRCLWGFRSRGNPPRYRSSQKRCEGWGTLGLIVGTEIKSRGSEILPPTLRKSGEEWGTLGFGYGTKIKSQNPGPLAKNARRTGHLGLAAEIKSGEWRSSSPTLRKSGEEWATPPSVLVMGRRSRVKTQALSQRTREGRGTLGLAAEIKSGEWRSSSPTLRKSGEEWATPLFGCGDEDQESKSPSVCRYVYNSAQLSLIHAVESRYRQPASPLLTSTILLSTIQNRNKEKTKWQNKEQ